ncbi:Rv2231c family pyridoxal phosphate-dependent protein CobC [Pseudonocardia saturnea]
MDHAPSTAHGALRHHGDVDAEPGLLDFAVNVQGTGPPRWLRDRIAAVLDDLGRYPGAAHDLAAREAVAARHGRRPDEVLVLAGSAEGFALLPALRPRLAAVLHPGFTEPEAALRDAGVPVARVLTSAVDGHRLHPAAVPADADLVVVGNPTNPTGVLHPADDVRALAAPGRVVLVDEAFADAVPGETESLAGEPGPLVFRSLTKTWALAGLRAGYALGAPELLARLARSRPPWPVSTPALEAVIACCEPAAVAQADEAAVRLAGRRAAQAAALAAVPGVTVLPGRAPYLLLRLPAGQGERVRGELRAAGIAVRRGDTFPGLDADHVRVAVRPAGAVARLVEALTVAVDCSKATLPQRDGMKVALLQSGGAQ